MDIVKPLFPWQAYSLFLTKSDHYKQSFNCHFIRQLVEQNDKQLQLPLHHMVTNLQFEHITE